MNKRFKKALSILLATTMVVTMYVPSAGVVEAASNMTIDNKNKTLYINSDNKTGTSDTYDFNIKNKTPNYKSKYRFTWYTANNDIIELYNTGLVRAKKTGKATLKCNIMKKSDGKLYQTCEATINVKENANKVEITNITQYKEKYMIDNKDGTYSYGMKANDTFDFNRKKYTASKSTSTDYTGWKSSNEEVGMIDKNGVFTAVSPGKTSIHVYTYQSSAYKDDPTAISADFEITVIQSENDVVYTYDGSEADIGDDFEGSGEDTDPYIIQTAGQLDKLATLVNEGERFTGKYFKLDRDISYQPKTVVPTATPEPVYTGVPNWIELDSPAQNLTYSRVWKAIGSGTYTMLDPIITQADFEGAVLKYGELYTIQGDGAYTQASAYNSDIENYYYYSCFDGSIDGDGHEISGLYYFEKAGAYTGFVGVLGKCGTIENLRISDAMLVTNNHVGGICAQNYGEIADCSFSGFITGNMGTAEYSSGGICGINKNTGKILRCSNNSEKNNGIVEGNSNVGGICGHNEADAVITDCYNMAILNASFNVGGICGTNEGSIANCYNIGIIGDTTEKIGAICGCNSATVENCYFTKATDGDSMPAIGNDDQNTLNNNGIVVNEETTSSEFSNGTICNKLNKGILNGTQAWYQNIEADVASNSYDSYPVLDNTHKTVCSKYTAGTESGFKEKTSEFTNNVSSGFNEPEFDNNTSCYMIASLSNLYWLSEQVSRGYSNIDAIVTASSDLIDEGIYSESGVLGEAQSGTRSWVPIGSDATPYTGTFDGNGKTICNLYVSNNSDEQGLFGNVGQRGTIKNINLKWSYFDGNDLVGGICGNNEGGTISGCDIIKCTIKGVNDIGGIAGYNSGRIEDCSTNGDSKVSTKTTELNTYTLEDETATDENTNSVSGNRIGGICGSNAGDSQSSIVQNCTNSALVNGIQDIGGICGFNDANIDLCNNVAAITGIYKSTGGVAGTNGGNITKSYNYADVTGVLYTGGVCGTNSGQILNCYNTHGKNVNGIKYIGGICGTNYNKVNACFNAATVTGTTGMIKVDTTPVSSTYVGSICGMIHAGDIDNTAGEVKNCYYLTGTATSDSNSQNGVGSATQNALEDVTDATIITSTELFANGSIAWSLNKASIDNTSSWYQNIGTDSYPVFDKTHNIIYKGVDGTYSGCKVIVTSQLEDNSSLSSIALLSIDYLSDSKVTVTAEDKQGYEFLGWYNADADNIQQYTGTVLCTELAYTFITTQGTSLIAVYKQLGDYKLNVTGVDFSVNGGARQITDYSADYPAGTTITLKATSPNFAYWKNETNKIVSKATTYTFTLGGNVTFSPVYESAGYVEFHSAYGQIIESKTYRETDTIVFPTAPSKLGYRFDKWSMTETEIKSAIASNIMCIRVEPIYILNTTTYTVNINRVDASDSYSAFGDLRTYKYTDGSTHTVTADEVTGKKFSHWASDPAGNNVLSYNETYYYTVTGNKSLYAVYIDSDSEKTVEPVSNITDKYGVIEGNNKKLVFIASRDIPNDYTVIETGTIYGRKDYIGDVTYEDAMVLNSSNAAVKYMKSSLTTLKGLFVMTLNIGDSSLTTNDGLIVCARGYVVIKNNKTGNMETIYSDVVQASYSEIKR